MTTYFELFRALSEELTPVAYSVNSSAHCWKCKMSAGVRFGSGKAMATSA